MEILTKRNADIALEVDRPEASREWDRPRGSREWDRPARATKRRFEVPFVLGAAVAFAFAGFAVLDAGHDAVVPALTPAVAATDAPVAAADLPLGAMYHVVDQVGARALWADGYTGAGVNVAVIDTGIAPVESLAADGKVVAAVDFTTDAPAPGAYIDTNGHGTFIAGIIAGNEPGSDPATAAAHPEQFLGVAPDAGIVSVKVDDGVDGADQADVISGIDWVIDHAAELHIGVINLSYNSGIAGSYLNDPFSAAVERAWDAGIVVVAAAGNDGAAADGLASPAHDPFVIAVAGAEVADDGISVADWSSSGDGVRNPDITAPGAHINSLRAPGSDADVNHPEGFVDAETFRGSGTSEATAVVSGVVALIRQAHPEWSPDQVKAAVAASAAPIAGATAERAGAGFVDAAAAAALAAPVGTQTFAQAAAPTVTPVSAGISTVWNGASWVGASWVGASWVGASWVGASWVGASWVGASWVGASWVGASWVGASWVGASWVGASWVGASWVGASWVGASWVGASWVGASWVWLPRGLVPRGSVPRGSVPRGSVPRGSVPRGSVPRGSVPRGSVPRGSVPRGLVPRGSVPRGSVPRGSVPRGSVPRGSVPRGSKVDGRTDRLIPEGRATAG